MTTEVFLSKLAELVDAYETANDNGIASVTVWPIGTRFFSPEKQTLYSWNGAEFVPYEEVFYALKPSIK